MEVLVIVLGRVANGPRVFSEVVFCLSGEGTADTGGAGGGLELPEGAFSVAPTSAVLVGSTVVLRGPASPPGAIGPASTLSDSFTRVPAGLPSLATAVGGLARSGKGQEHGRAGLRAGLADYATPPLSLSRASAIDVATPTASMLGGQAEPERYESPRTQRGLERVETLLE